MGRASWYVQGAPARTRIQVIDAATGSEAPLFDVARLRRALAAELGHEPPYEGVPFSEMTLSRKDSAEFTLEGRTLRLDLGSYALQRVRGPDPVEEVFGISERARFTPREFQREIVFGATDALEVASPDARWFASLRDGNLWLRSTVDGRAVPLTADAGGDIGWDLEGGVRSPWSPDATQLFAVRYDHAGVFRLPVVHMLKRDEEVTFQRFQKAGARLDRAQPYVVPVLGKAPVRIELGDTTDQYFRLLGWRPDGSEVLLARFARDFRRVDILAANARSGAARTLMTEASRSFVRIQHDVIWGDFDVGFTPLPSGKGFLWLSERDGWNHAYLYDAEGRLQRQLTRGAFPVQQVLRVDEAGGWVYLMASAETARPYDTHLYRVPLAGGRLQRLTEGEGTHRVRLSPSANAFVDTYSSVSRPPRTELRSSDGRLLKVIEEADIARLRAAGWIEPEEFTVKAADGVTDLRGVLYKPHDFDPARKYPLLEYIYGGPQTHNLPVDFCGSGQRDANFPRALAETGYLVAVVAGRGTPGRSEAFHDAVLGDWADHVVADHAGAMRQLVAQRAYVDGARIGVWGRSWGGHFAFRLLAEAGDLYKAAVSIVPGFDPYNGVLYEPYLGLPEQNRAAYEAASPFRLAARIHGALLMIGGTLDTSTYYDILRMDAALVDAKVHHESLILPNQEHQFGGAAADFYRDEVIRFFEREVAGRAAAR